MFSYFFVISKFLLYVNCCLFSLCYIHFDNALSLFHCLLCFGGFCNKNCCAFFARSEESEKVQGSCGVFLLFQKLKKFQLIILLSLFFWLSFSPFTKSVWCLFFPMFFLLLLLLLLCGILNFSGSGWLLKFVVVHWIFMCNVGILLCVWCLRAHMRVWIILSVYRIIYFCFGY